jgi:ketosteroid isomerase-like protein
MRVAEFVKPVVSGEEMLRTAERLEGLVTDDFECVMVTAFDAEHHRGLDGFARAWRDWIEPYSSYTAETEAVEEREDATLFLVRQRGVTRRDGVEIETSSGSIWRFREGKVARTEFYLDREAALAAFG